ncbi:MAG TPA: 4-alpha-glucanotransferase [Thermoanaerobaculia bacterium]|nr:4-alpha-glucanotransferase [Thermoanaerobaculia bacterium]
MVHTSDGGGRNVNRSAGVLLHPTSLPGRFGVGDLGDELLAFLDWAERAGMHIWQVLPLNPPGYGYSPYGCISSFAGNPLLISPQRLIEAGLLPSIGNVPDFVNDHVDFERVTAFKNQLLRDSFAHFEANGRAEQRSALKRFERDNKWLPEWALYAALKEKYEGMQWSAWPRELAKREKDAIAAANDALADEIRFHKYVQWLFFTQWAAVREAAYARKIRIMGDVPIYVAGDSADVWANRNLFQLDENGEPRFVAGVPPDYFSETGQRWGNPLYDWDKMRSQNFRWWVARIRANLRFADMLRLDHFRGFAAYWEVAASEKTAMNGRWVPGPGRALFDAIRDAIGDVPLVAEDLGFITAEVHELRRAIEIPGMKILQFGFSHVDSPHLPHRYEPETVAYTGTHDNDTARGWYDTAPAAERALAHEYLGCASDGFSDSLMRAAFTSVAETAIVPVQDILDLGSDARMNRPGAKSDNWSWRMEPGALTSRDATKMRRLAEITGRV